MTELQKKLDAIQNLMRQGQFESAKRDASQLFLDEPHNIEALYMKAVCERYLKQYDEARESLKKLHTIRPEFGRALQEEGHLNRDQEQFDKALAAYQKACRANPALIVSWREQAKILDRRGCSNDAAQAMAQANRLAALPQDLATVTHLIHEGKILIAERLCRKFLQANPHNKEGMRLLADIGGRFGVFNEADFLLESAIEFYPDDIQLRLDYIQVLRKRQKFAAALKQAAVLYERDPESPLFQSHLAIESMQTGDHERAFDLFEKVLKKIPGDPATLTSRGHAFKTFGKHKGAVESYRAAYRSRPEHGDAYFGLANLKTYKFTHSEIRQMLALTEREDISFMDHVHLCFSLGKAFEDRTDYEKSFIQYERGNDLKSVQSPYTADNMKKELENQAEICTRELFEKQGGKGDPAPDPISSLDYRAQDQHYWSKLLLPIARLMEHWNSPIFYPCHFSYGAGENRILKVATRAFCTNSLPGN